MAIARNPFDGEEAWRRQMNQAQDDSKRLPEGAKVDIVEALTTQQNYATPRASVLEEASKIVYGDRERTYGSPAKNLNCIAKLWNAYLDSVHGRPLNNKDVAVMMVLLKSARLANDPSHRDSVVDICGYAALVERCDE